MRTPPSERYVPLVEALYLRTTGLWFSYGELATAIGHGHTGRQWPRRSPTWRATTASRTAAG